MLLCPHLPRAFLLSLAIVASASVSASACGGSPEDDPEGGGSSSNGPPGGADCFVSCAGACRLGVCLDAPVHLASLPDNTRRISVEENALVYHTFHAADPGPWTIRRRLLDTGADETIAELPYGRGAILEGDTVYYYTLSPDEVRRLDLTTGAETVLLAGEGGLGLLLVDDALIFNTYQDLYRIPLDGGAAVRLFDSVEELVLGDDIYYLSYDPSEQRHLGRIPRAGGAAEELMEVSGGAQFLQFAGGSLYWHDTVAAGAIFGLPVPVAAGATPATVCGGANMLEMAVDDRAVLFGNDGGIEECPLAGGGPSRVWEHLGGISQFAVNDPHVAAFESTDSEGLPVDGVEVYRLPAAP